MSQEHTPPSPGESSDVPFQLALAGHDRLNAEVTGEVTSGLLDSVLHPSAKLQVKVYAEEPINKLDPFELDSLIQYLRGQSEVRSILERELPRDRANWVKKPSTDDGNILQSVKLRALLLRPRRVPTPQMLANWRKLMGDKQAEAVAAQEDTPQTHSYFEILLGCSWDREHQVKALFRDGAFVGIAHE